jgi:hypothetical protein
MARAPDWEFWTTLCYRDHPIPSYREQRLIMAASNEFGCADGDEPNGRLCRML